VKQINISHFTEWIEKNNIKKRSIDGYWNYFNNYRKEEPEEFEQLLAGKDPLSFELEIKQISLTISYEFDNEVNLVSSDVIIKHKGEEIGLYTAVFTTNGDGFDDYLKFY
jgi:hypothetical protein